MVLNESDKLAILFCCCSVLAFTLGNSPENFVGTYFYAVGC